MLDVNSRHATDRLLQNYMKECDWWFPFTQYLTSESDKPLFRKHCIMWNKCRINAINIILLMQVDAASNCKNEFFVHSIRTKGSLVKRPHHLGFQYLHKKLKKSILYWFLFVRLLTKKNINQSNKNTSIPTKTDTMTLHNVSLINCTIYQNRLNYLSTI